MSKYFLFLSIVPFILSGCQTMDDYVFFNAKQGQDKSSTYKLNNKVDIDKSIEKTPDALNVKKQIIGEYQVNEQWTTYLHWKIDKINIHINDESSVIVDLYAPGKKQPFYGFKANNCSSQIYKTQFEQNSSFKYEDMTKREKRISDAFSLGQNAIKCGWISKSYNVVDVLKVKKGDERTVYESGKFGSWLNFKKVIAPKDGYFIQLRDEFATESIQFSGIILFAEKLE